MHRLVGTAVYLNIVFTQQSMNAFSFLTKNIDIYFTAHTFFYFVYTHISQTHRHTYTHKSKSVKA